MGKSKHGKNRQDKYYHFAKEQGYRARSAFKLIQLNKKYDFLGSSKVLVDLCAAPGGWLQVASKNMPIQSLIIGVDLVQIKPIPNCFTFQADITTDKCKSMIQSKLKDWGVDVVLHDGAPNVGTNWIQDAYSQSELVLKAFKLAVELLKPGGIFLTKIFRSKDYNNLLWVFNQLFESVEATKPSSSRNESAEIFVFCKGYLAPKKVDPKFTDPAYVFKDLAPEDIGNKLNTVKGVFSQLQKEKKDAIGYDENDFIVYKDADVVEFIKAENPTVFLASYYALKFDSDIAKQIYNHKVTDFEIKELCKDLKVLNKSEFKILLKWRFLLIKLNFVTDLPTEETPTIEKENEKVQEEESTIDELNLSLKLNSKKMDKEKKKIIKQKQKDLLKLKHRSNDMVDTDVNYITTLRFSNVPVEKVTKLAVQELDNLEPIVEHESSSSEEEFIVVNKKDAENNLEELIDQQYEYKKENKLTTTEKIELHDKKMGIYRPKEDQFSDSDSSSNKEDSESEDHNDESFKKEAPKELSKEAAIWYTRPEFKNIGPLKNTEISVTKGTEQKENETKAKKEETKKEKVKKQKFSIDTPEAFQLAYELVNKQTTIHNMIDDSYHKDVYNDQELLPKWFVEDEERNCVKHIPITKEMADLYKREQRELNNRPIKKVAEAKARRKLKHYKKIKEISEKANAIVNNPEISEKEKSHTVHKLLSKKNTKAPTRKTHLVVARGGNKAKGGRPSGVKGRYKMVDRTMKKELFKKNLREKKAKKGKRGKVSKK